ncbi:SDR family oxidoreductase sniffer isoform X2 [Arctopsyche grandis]|uniref:SDR family oxidoreductase sniffer isoform X2 n=1 Tax=Arctopsyche grandis TaxID=121162 RepID=UPI00406D8AFA
MKTTQIKTEYKNSHFIFEQELQELSGKFENLHIVKLDLSDIDSYKSVVEEISNYTKENGLNLLINNAGVTSKFTTLNYVKSQQLIDNFMINTVAPILLTKQLLPLLKLASQKNPSSIGINRAAIVNMSSILGSIALNDNGGFYPYRCSKTALNAATRSMSIDLKKDNIMVVSLHPGWVKTDMGGANAPLDIETSTQGMIKTLESLNETSTGRFYQYDGEELAW